MVRGHREECFVLFIAFVDCYIRFENKSTQKLAILFLKKAPLLGSATLLIRRVGGSRFSRMKRPSEKNSIKQRVQWVEITK